MAINTFGVQLMKGVVVGNVTTYSKLIDVKDFPDLGGAPEGLETTTLSDASQVFINGIQSSSPMEFIANYVAADYATLIALEGVPTPYSIWFGTNGSLGKFNWTGELGVWLVGGGVNSVVDMKLSISPSTELTEVPEIGVLTVTSVAGSLSGKTAISVAPAKGVGNTYVYKTAAIVPLPMYYDICNVGSGYTAWNGTADITATTGHTIVIVEIDSDSRAIKTGSATVVSLA